MNSRMLSRKQARRRYWAPLLGLPLAIHPLWAAETNAPPAAANPPATSTNAPPAAAAAKPAEAPKPLTPEQMFEGGEKTYNNWVELSAGGFITSGNEAQMEQQRHHTSGAFGGIEDLHYQGDLAKGTTFTIDGHSIFGNDDYSLKLGVTREKLGYLRLSVSQFRTFYNGDGGFYGPTGAYYRLGEDALTLDRREISLEGGLTLDKLPTITFKYTHRDRDGDKSSTIWGITHPVGLALTRGLSPSLYDIDESSDSFQIDATHHIKATTLGLGFRYENARLDDSLLITQGPGEPGQQKITNQQGTDYDLFNVHGFTETWLKKNLLLSTGLSYSDLDNDFSGSRIYGSDFDVNYVPSAPAGFGYYNLAGGSRLHEYVLDVNLLDLPTPTLAIVPSLRVMKEDTDADANGLETLGAQTPTPFNATSDQSVLDVRERLDVRYNGITNWVFWVRGDLTEGNGNLKENGGLLPMNGIGIEPIDRNTDDSRLFQKYSAGARWYPARTVTLEAGGYYKLNEYHYNHLFDSTPNNSFTRYPAYLIMQDFDTYDGNVELTLRSRSNVTLVSRYEYQLSHIHTQPDPISGLSNVEASVMTSHILGENISWTPWSWLNLQAGFNYVLSDTRTPASEITQAILNAQNNYWTLNFNSGIVLNDKTDLNLGYFYYEADDFQDNSAFGVPLGPGEHEHGVMATLVRRINKNIRLLLRYGYYQYSDVTYGGNRDYTAHLVYSSMQYRF